MRRLSQSIIFVLLACLCILAKAQSDQTVKNGEQTQVINFPGAGCTYNWTNNKPGIGLAASGTGDIPSFIAINNGTAIITATIKATPVLASYAYIANQGNGSVNVIDGASHNVIGQIPIGTTPVGVVASPDGKHVYTANNVSNNVSVISTVDNSVITIPVGNFPFAIAISPDSRWVYVSNQNDGSISVIDAQSNSVSATVKNVGSITSICVSPDGKWVYAATEASPEYLYIIDASNNTVASKIALPASQNVGMVITPDGKTLFLTADVDNTSNPNGFVSVIDLTTRSISAITVGSYPKKTTFKSGPYGITMNSTGTRVYVVCSYQNEVDVINTATNTVIKTIDIPDGQVFTVSLSNDDKEFYVVNRGSNSVEVFNTSNYSKITTITDPNFNSPFSSGNFMSKGPGCGGSPVTYTIKVLPSVPTLAAPNTASGTISACAGSPSASPDIQQFTLSGSSLKGAVTVQAPANFEVSLNATSGYTNFLSLTPAAGSLAQQVIYVRSKQSAPVGTISDKVKITSTGAVTVQVAVNGRVTALPVVNPLGPRIYNAGDVTSPITFTGPGNTFLWSNDNTGIGLAASGVGDIASFTATNTTANTIVGNVTVTPVSAGYAFITNEGAKTVSIINTVTNEVVKTVDVGGNPYAVAVTPDGSKAYVTNLADNTISIINTSDFKVTTISAGNSPYGIIMSPDGSKAYVANLNGNSISVINTANNAVSVLTSVDSPYGIALNADGSKLYVTSYSSKKLNVIDIATKSITATVDVGSFPWAVTTSSDGARLYVTNSGDGSISVLDAATVTLIKIFYVGSAPTGLVASPDGKELYVVSGAQNSITAYSTSDYSITGTIGGGGNPVGIAYSSDGLLYVPNVFSNNVFVIDPVTHHVIKTIPVGISPGTMGNFISKGANCTGATVSFPIKVNASQVKITAGDVTGSITTCAGSPSAGSDIQQFTVTGDGLTGDITATAPVNFEVSLSANSGFGTAVVLRQSGGKVGNVIVYVRTAASAITGSLSGNVVLTSPGAASKNVKVDGVVNALPTVNNPGTQTYANGDVTNAINFTGTGNIFSWVNDKPAIGLAANGTGDIPSFTAINTGAGPVTATVTVTPSSGAFAYVANGDDNNVSVINTTTHALVTKIGVGQSPTYVCVSPDGRRVYVVNNNSNSISVINTGDNKVIKEISFGSINQAIVSPDNKFLYVADYSVKEIRIINTNTFAEDAPVMLSEQPAGIAINAGGNKLYVTNPLANTVSVIDIAAKSITANINVNSQPLGIIMSPDGLWVYVTNFLSNSISVINTATNNVDFTISSTPANPDAISISADGSRLFVANFGDGSVSVINTATYAISAKIATGVHPSAVDVSADGAFIYVVNQGSNNMSVISTATNSVTTDIPTGTSPKSPGKFIVNGTGCTGVPVTFTIKVNSQSPTLTHTPVTGTITACAGSPSASPNIQQFTVNGTGLSGHVKVIAPANFEVSLSANTGFGGAVTLTQSTGAVNNVTVYVRSAASAPAGPLNDKITLSTPGLSDVTFAVNGQVNAVPTVDAIAVQTKTSGDATDPINFTGTGNAFQWTNDKPEIGLATSGTGNIGSFTAINNGTSPVIATITVTPVSSGYAYVANAQNNNVSVIDLATSSVKTPIDVGVNPYGVAVDKVRKLVYVSNSGENTISVIDAVTNTVKGNKITVGSSPYGIRLSPDGSKLYTANFMSNSVTVINTSDNSIITTIYGFKGPADIAVSPDGSTIYVSNGNSNNVTVINTADYSILKTIDVSTSPYMMRMSPDGTKLYVATTFGKDVSVITTATNTFTTTISGGLSPYGLGLSPDGKTLYVPNLAKGSISVYNTTTNNLITEVLGFDGPTGITFSADGKYYYVTNQRANTVSIVDAQSNTIIKPITVGADPISMGDFVLPGGGCDGLPVTFTIKVIPPLPAAISTDQPLAGVNTVYGTPSTATTFTISGDHMREGIKITPPAGVEVSSDGVNFSPAIIVGGAGTIPPTTIYVRLPKTAPVSNNYGGPIVLTSAGASTVSPELPPSEVTPAVLTLKAKPKNKDYGTELTKVTGSTDFIISGLQNDETAQTVTVTYGPGSAAADPVQVYAGSVTLSDLTGGTFDPKNYTIAPLFPADLTVNKVLLEITADNKTKIYKDPNPQLTITYKSFVNGETVAQLTTPPVISTAADETSLPGTFPIIVSGATSPNYDIKFNNGVLTVRPLVLALKIPNTFTPNGDGINDTWNIVNIDAYPGCTVNIFNRWGQKVYTSVGYAKSWDGLYNNGQLPVGTYYYIIDLKNGTKVYSGDVTIIR